ncbi:MAG: DUF6009 family protein [Bacillota bacterium]
MIDYSKEAELVWYDDPLKYDYLRESCVYCRTRTRPVLLSAMGERKQVIGYAVLRPDVEPDERALGGACYWHRRVWWLYTDDAGMPEDKGVYGRRTGRYPVEAVAPPTVQAGRPSVYLASRPTLAELEERDPRLARLAAWLRKKGAAASVSAREVRRSGAAGVKTSEEARALLEELAALGWGRVVERQHGSLVFELL